MIDGTYKKKKTSTPHSFPCLLYRKVREAEKDKIAIRLEIICSLNLCRKKYEVFFMQKLYDTLKFSIETPNLDITFGSFDKFNLVIPNDKIFSEVINELST